MKLQCIRNDGAIIMASLKCLCNEKGISVATLVLISEECDHFDNIAAFLRRTRQNRRAALLSII